MKTTMSLSMTAWMLTMGMTAAQESRSTQRLETAAGQTDEAAQENRAGPLVVYQAKGGLSALFDRLEIRNDGQAQAWRENSTTAQQGETVLQPAELDGLKKALTAAFKSEESGGTYPESGEARTFKVSMKRDGDLASFESTRPEGAEAEVVDRLQAIHATILEGSRAGGAGSIDISVGEPNSDLAGRGVSINDKLLVTYRFDEEGRRHELQRRELDEESREVFNKLMSAAEQQAGEESEEDPWVEILPWYGEDDRDGPRSEEPKKSDEPSTKAVMNVIVYPQPIGLEHEEPRRDKHSPSELQMLKETLLKLVLKA